VALKLKKTCVPASLRKLKELSQFVDEIANLRHNPRQPWLAPPRSRTRAAPTSTPCKSSRRVTRHIDPALVGNARNVLISDLAGRSNIVMKAQELGFKLTNDTPELKPILNRIKELEHAGYEFEARRGVARVAHWQTLNIANRCFTWMPITFPCAAMAWESVCDATIKVRVGNKRAQTVAEGDGPVNALDGALRAALVKFYPQLKKVTLTDYKVRILDSDTGTAAKTRVLIESSDGRRDWGTVGVSENIIEASLQALVDSMEFALLRR